MTLYRKSRPGLAISVTESPLELPLELPLESIVDPQGASPHPSGQVMDLNFLSAEEVRKVRILDEILLKKNDNDPRIDTELKGFTAAAKNVIRARYTRIPAEKRNEKGTLVFLLGREIHDLTDLEFFSGVLAESPCLSLQDCSRSPEAHSSEEEHFQSINETTANYPQLMALRALKQKAEELLEGPLYAEILKILHGSAASPDSRVSIEAGRILEELEKE